MAKFFYLLLVLTLATAGLAEEDLPLPGPGVPPNEPAPPQPTPPPTIDPTPTPGPTTPPRKTPKRKPRIPKPTPPYPEEPTPRPIPNPAPKPPKVNRNTFTVGVGQVGRFKERKFTFFIPAHRSEIRALRITCTQQEIKIKDVLVQYVDGQESNQYLLAGTLEKGQSTITYLHGYPVFKITVVATSSSVFKGKGAFRLDATFLPLQRRSTGEDTE